VLAGRVVAVTGASRGLGEAMAVGLAEAGASVVLLARTLPDLERVAAVCKELASDVLYVPTDVTSESQVQGVVLRIAETYGRLDGWINNAGVGPVAIRKDWDRQPIKIHEIPTETWKLTVDLNMNALFTCTREAVALMAKTGDGGSIINIITSPWMMERPGLMPYGATKAAVWAMTRAFAAELKPLNIRVNALGPGGAARSAQLPEAFADPNVRIFDAKVLVPATIYLMSPENEQVSGEMILAAQWNRGHGFDEDGNRLPKTTRSSP